MQITIPLSTPLFRSSLIYYVSGHSREYLVGSRVDNVELCHKSNIVYLVVGTWWLLYALYCCSGHSINHHPLKARMSQNRKRKYLSRGYFQFFACLLRTAISIGPGISKMLNQAFLFDLFSASRPSGFAETLSFCLSYWVFPLKFWGNVWRLQKLNIFALKIVPIP